MWDKKTGQINHTVAASWQAKDIRAYLASHWSTVGGAGTRENLSLRRRHRHVLPQ
ncbi:hypothetical protein [Fodinicola feengrottensis]|uniref:hypothetical protein n=1 Tax=Fodinicola feengrottensis TaxID=435914 RepID=UPI00244351D2|nr:hypothetical protein [Fodinicola feengrottensis]